MVIKVLYDKVLNAVVYIRCEGEIVTNAFLFVARVNSVECCCVRCEGERLLNAVVCVARVNAC